MALALLAGAGLVAALAWWRTAASDGPGAAAQPAVAQPSAPPLVDTPPSERIDRPATMQLGDRRYLPELFDPARYQGTARVEVVLDAPAGFNGAWTLAFAPSRVVSGGQHAQARSIEVPAGERHVLLSDVALGGYEVRALAEGMECAPQYIQFAKPHEVDVVLRLALFAAGDLSGRVLNGDGSPLARMPVTARRKLPLLERSAQTDAAGYYVFQRLPDGDWELAVGYADAPLVTRELSFAAPGFSMPDLHTPQLDELTVRVVDEQRSALANAKVSVIGLASGAREALTDAAGVARLAHCVAGEATLYVESAPYTAVSQQIQFQPGELSEHHVRMIVR